VYTVFSRYENLRWQDISPYVIKQNNGKTLTVRTQDISANCVVFGNPAKARQVGWED
jgi:hypothetical protein